MEELNPGLAAALKELADHPEVHANNHFAHDVVSKFHRYGSLSEAQVTALISSIARDYEAAAPKGPAPEGRQTVTGTVLSVKLKESIYGAAWKLLVKLDNNSKVWVTRPRGAECVACGDSITFTATFERSKDDPSFAFGKRPELTDPFNSPKAAKSTTRDVAKPVKAAKPVEPEPEPEPEKPSILATLLAEL